jgi:hypothetical protein
MISNPDVAKQISDLMQDIFQRLDESAAMVRSSCQTEEAATYQKAVGRVVGPILFEVLEPLYQKHPTLKPANWDD